MKRPGCHVGVEPKVNWRNALHIGDKAQQGGDPAQRWNLEEISSEAQNSAICDPTKTLLCFNFFKKN